MQSNMFFDNVVAAILCDLFNMVLKTCGSKVRTEFKSPALSHAQRKTAADIEETLSLFAQRRGIGSSMRDAMPKAIYWFGTSPLGNWVLSRCMDSVLRKTDSADMTQTADDDLFVTAVNFLHWRSLFGQNVLFCAV